MSDDLTQKLPGGNLRDELKLWSLRLPSAFARRPEPASSFRIHSFGRLVAARRQLLPRRAVG
jgi:hypothetical protein